MPRTHLSPAELKALHDLAAPWGKIIARRTGDHDLELDLHALEQIAQAAAAGLGRRHPAMLAGPPGRRPGWPATLPQLRPLLPAHL